MAFRTENNGPLHAPPMPSPSGTPKARGTHPRKEVMTTVAETIRFP